MQRSMLSGQRLVAIFIAGCVLFNYPVLAIFDRAAEAFGIPLVVAYLFALWAALIALMAWVVEHGGDARGERRGERGGG